MQTAIFVCYLCNVLPLAVSGGLKKTDFRLTTKFKKMQETNNLPQTPPLQQTAVMPRFFFVFVQIGTDEYKMLAEGIDTYQDAVEIRDAYKSKFKNQPFVVASLNEA